MPNRLGPAWESALAALLLNQLGQRERTLHTLCGLAVPAQNGLTGPDPANQVARARPAKR